jgi:hypothetical protein
MGFVAENMVEENMLLKVQPYILIFQILKLRLEVMLEEQVAAHDLNHVIKLLRSAEG